MRISVKALLAALTALSLPAAASAQTPAPARQDPAALRQVAEQFLRVQSAGLPGEAQISVGQVDPRMNLAVCPAPEAFLPAGSRAWGKTTVGIRCNAPSTWTIYIAATVRVQGEYLVAAAPLAQGKTLGPEDIVGMRGELTALPAGIVTDVSQAVGRTMAISLPAGAPLRADSLRSVAAVQQGQTVRIVSAGPGFRVSAEGRALNNAADGQVAQARTASGQVVSGVARAGGVVEVTY
ncbi:flagellar basal body P-ring formation chaperone FlgA [Noviherbaspirillum aridicola]|uniref:Flagella basal body P-ring formation protein FlgA n=1 Tax=Noviherbaspirillum aridicola TaxID=2849687 RepID=A0ABQ4Q624_9BURK|nr:flagellar basal body P-ring formation chaperone FlgA [Noviherbaspirillum aridicola]GIZ52662.1 flagellar basal body P-ring biosynthesis protein FlgA [Noviherbaspirillum aridicola]